MTNNKNKNQSRPNKPNQSNRSNPAQRQSRKRRRERNPGPAKKGRGRNRNRNRANRDRTVSDGLNYQRTMVNNSTIVDEFQLRREKVTLINGSTSFNNLSFYINPANSSLFKVFAGIAANYEEYRIKKLKFIFETESYTSIGSNVSSGRNIMVTNYDVTDAPFSDDTSAENYCGAVKGPPFTRLEHKINAKTQDKRGYNPLATYFVNYSANNAAPAGDSTNAKFYDAGLFQFITNNQATTSTIGELYVEYQFTMIRPKQLSTSYSGLNSLAFHIKEGANNTASATARMGTTSGIVASGSTLNPLPNTNAFTLSQAGTFFLSATWYTGNNNISAAPSMALGASLSTSQFWQDDNASFNSFVSSSGAYAVWNGIITVNTSGSSSFNYVTIGGLTGMTAADCDIWCVQIPSSINSVAINIDQEKKIIALEAKLEKISKFLQLLEEKECYPVSPKSLDLSSKLSESQLIDKAISKTLRRVKADELKTTDTPNVSPGWFNRS